MINRVAQKENDVLGKEYIKGILSFKTMNVYEYIIV